jgi:alkylhydroperoxidase/carboxymuconolactone decarboxylase family protein YurZ
VPEDTLQAGFLVRRSVLGDAHVDRSIACATGFTRDFQEMITRYAWGTVWTRPGLDPRVRRLLYAGVPAANAGFHTAADEQSKQGS